MRYAAILAGISESTAYHWRMTGEAELASHKQGDGELGSHALFVQTVKEAEAGCVSDQLTHWADSSGKDFANYATLLERRFPKDFGRNQQITVESTVTYVHELGPGAEAAILARHQELEALQGATETDTGGLPALPPAQQPDAPHTTQNQPSTA